MRLWHKDLIPVLPRQQLLSQWRECCCIASNIVVKGTPNHILVNKVLDYSSIDFIRYCEEIIGEMHSRGYTVSIGAQSTLINNIEKVKERFNNSVQDDSTTAPRAYDIYNEWHNDRYFLQCYFNLQEKHDCGGISEEEWNKIYIYTIKHKFNSIFEFIS